MTHKYEIHLFWSDDDDCYIANVPDLEYCSAHGNTYEEALKEIQVAMGLWIDVQRERGYPIPEPKTWTNVPTEEELAFAKRVESWLNDDED